MKLRHKILATVFAYLKPVLIPVMNWYAKRKMRKMQEKMQKEMISE